MTPSNSGNFKRDVIEDADRTAKLDALLETRIMEHIKDHETRLRDMEKWQWKMMGVGLVAGFAMVIFTGVATSTITEDIRQIRQIVTTAPTRR